MQLARISMTIKHHPLNLDPVLIRESVVINSTPSNSCRPCKSKFQIFLRGTKMKDCIGKSSWELCSLKSIQEWLEDDDDDEDDLLDIDMLLSETPTQTGNSRSKRKREETDNEDETDSQQGENSLNSTVDGDSEDETDSQQGEASLNSTVDGDSEDETDSQQGEASLSSTVVDGDSEDETKLEIQEKRERVKRKMLEISVARTKLMEEKLEREYASSVERVIEILNELPGVRMCSPFHEASVNHLLANVANRQGFVAFPSAEDKIRFLEFRTGRKLDD